MHKVNVKSVVLGTLAGALAWLVWTSVMTMSFLAPVYSTEQKAEHIFAIPRYGALPFFLSWILVILGISLIANWLYTIARTVLGAGPRTALLIGAALGLAASAPVNLSVSSWIQVSPTIPLFWAIDVWGGITLATLVGAFCYRERSAS